jgi:hypothetical protein
VATQPGNPPTPASSSPNNGTGGLVPSNRVVATDVSFDQSTLQASYQNHLFLRASGRFIRFENVNFKHTIFDQCYLRKCVFENCDFTGCRFVNSNLRGSSFSRCTFDYAHFEKTLVDEDILSTSSPSLENLKLYFARALRVNYQSLGNSAAANRAIAIELEATEQHYYNAAWGKSGYYQSEFQGARRLEYIIKWIDFKIMDFIWGNGESAFKLLRTVFLITILMMIPHLIITKNINFSDIVNSLGYTPQVFFGVESPPSYPGWYLTLVNIFRLVLFGFFMSIIVKRYNRR